MKARITNWAWLSHRATAFGTIVAVHGVIVYAMANDLAHASSEIIMPLFYAAIIPEDPQPLMQREPIPAPQMKRLRVEIPPPDIEIDFPVDASNAITDVTAGAYMMMEKKAAPPPSGPASKPAPRYIIHARVGEHFPNPDAFYPPASVRREEQGVVSVQVCIGLDGTMTEEPMVVKTSGVARLDEAALKVARSGHYLAGSVDGLPIVDCLQLPIRFKMKH